MDISVSNFAHIRSAVVPLDDLVVLVGPQATGKSLILQLLKLAKDRTRIARVLKGHGFAWRGAGEFAPLFFGAGFEHSWKESSTRVAIGRTELTLDQAARSKAMPGEERVFYVPAHRTLTISEGWPRPFLQFQVETPYVARRFSEQILELLSRGLGGATGKIFPQEGRLKATFKQAIDDAVFHGASLKLQATGMRRQFVLDYREAQVPYMSWTAGQREFIPLLLGLYHLLPAGKLPKRTDIEWVIIEEPEMGLHPKAIVAVMGSILELLHRGYRVALSTHSPTVVETLWALERLQGIASGPKRLCKIFQVKPSKHVLETMASALAKPRAVVHLQHADDGKVVSTNISGLKPTSTSEAEAYWGGLTNFSARVSRAVAEAAAERSRRGR